MGSKFSNKKTTINGITFDSKKEAGRWVELNLLLRAGEIKDLERQVKYVLIPKQDGERECAYIADFVYRENGKVVIEDVKGYRGGAAYEIFKIKRKLVLLNYGIKIREV